MLSRDFLFVCEGCPSNFASKCSCIPAFVTGRREPFADVVVRTFVYEKHAIAHALFFYFFCRLSVVVVLICYQTVADVIFSCAYSPDEVIHILHTVTPPAECFCVTSRKGTVLSLSVPADQARSE